MKHFLPRLTMGIWLVGQIACQTPGSLVNVEPIGNLPAEITEKGKPIGAPVVKSIGPEGGTLTSPDGSLQLTFPAGALSAATPLRLQMVENKAAGGIGPAFEVTPKDTKLNKPVSLAWKFGKDGLNGTATNVVGLARQREDGAWLGKSNLKADVATQTLTVPTFDLKYPLAFYQNFYLKYDASVLVPNQQIMLTVAYQPNHSDKEESESRETLLASLKPWEPVDHTNLRNWRLNGEPALSANKANGSLNVHNKGEKALYIAPSKVPANNPMAISVDLKTGGRSQIILVANVTVVAANRMTINGKIYENPKVSVNNDESGSRIYISMQEVMPPDASYPAGLSVSIKNFKGKGTYTIESDENCRMDGKESGKTGKLFDSQYVDPISFDMVYSKGSITITEYNGKLGTIAGTFSATLYHEPGRYKPVQAGAFGGEFRTIEN